MNAPEIIRIQPAQGEFVPVISHTSMGVRVIPLLLAGQSYSTGPFMIRGYNKLKIINKSNAKAQIYVYMGPDPLALQLFTPGDRNEKARFEYQPASVPNGNLPPEQYDIQVTGDFVRIVYVNDTLLDQLEWQYQVTLTPIGEGSALRVFDDLAPNPLYDPLYKYLTVDTVGRLRVNAIIGGPGGVVEVEGRDIVQQIMAQNGALGAGLFLGAYTFSILAPAYSKICLSTSIHISGSGQIIINYRTSNTNAWRNYENIPLSYDLHQEKVWTPTRGEYQIDFQAGPAGVSGLDMVVELIPQT